MLPHFWQLTVGWLSGRYTGISLDVQAVREDNNRDSSTSSLADKHHHFFVATAIFPSMNKHPNTLSAASVKASKKFWNQTENKLETCIYMHWKFGVVCPRACKHLIVMWRGCEVFYKNSNIVSFVTCTIETVQEMTTNSMAHSNCTKNTSDSNQA